jgi:LPS export ABC transporter protein LptC
MKKAAYLSILIILVSGCTFDYGQSESSGEDIPDLIMEKVDYMRVRSADPLARFQAERAERYESLGVMRLQKFSFEQYGERGTEVNAAGMAGYASVDINTSDISMDRGVRIEVDSEDIIIETNQLEWRDEPKTLYTEDDAAVNIYQNNGTGFTGIGLYAEARNRVWEFKGEVSGIFIHDDDEETDEISDGDDAQ